MKTFTRISSVLTLALAVCWGSLSAQFTCDAPLVLNCGDVTFGSTTGVTNDNATSAAPTCITAVGTNGQYWYSFTSPGDGTAVMSLVSANTDYDTKIHVYTGSCGSLTCVTGNDDFAGLQSQVTFNMVGGTVYLVRVGGYTTNEGNFQLSVTCDLLADGCTDPVACNFDPIATNNDGTCCYGICETLVVDGGFNDLQVAWELRDAGGALIASGGAPFNGVVCLPSADCGYQMIMTDSGANGWNGNEYTFTNAAGDVEASGTLDAGAGPETDILALGGLISGCMDMLATNYDPNAQCDNGTCVTCTGGSQLYSVNMTDVFGDGWNGAAWFIIDDLGGTVATGTLADGDAGSYIDCLPQGCYTFTTTNGSFPAEVGWTLTDLSGTVLLSGVAGANVGFSWAGATGCIIPGCTDAGCNNYNQFATVDDGSCVCPPSNDDCANAIAIGCGQSITGTTINANDDGITGTCTGIAVTSPGVWYTFIGTGDAFSLSTCNSGGGDTKIHVFTGDCSAPICVAANDDGCGTGFLSSIAFTSVSGFAYYVLVSEFGAGVGIDFTLDVACVDCNGTQINDVCDNALPIPAGVDFPGNLCCSNPDGDMSPWAGFGTQYGIWYTINSADFDALSISFFNGSGQGVDATDGTDVGIGVFDGSAGCGALNPLVGGVGFDSDPADGSTLDGFIFNSYEFGITLIPNTDYYFCLTTSDPINCGDFVLNVSLSNVGCTDAIACNYDATATIDDGNCEYISCGAQTPNDSCINAIPLVCGTSYFGSTGNATNVGAPTVCPVGAGDIGVWYTFTGDGQFVTLSTCGSAIDSRITVVSSATGCGGPYTCVISEDDDATDAGCGAFNADDASVEFVSVVGTQYFVYITAGGTDTNGDFVDDLFEGPFSLSFDCAPVVNGCLDACACNYNANANVDDGSCDYFSCAGCAVGSSAVMMDMVDTFGDGWNGNTYSIEDITGTVVAEGSLNDAQCGDFQEAGFDVFCLPNGCYSMIVGGGNFGAEVQWTLNDNTGATILNGSTGTFAFTIGGGTCGCTDPTACNFDAAATQDDGSCESLSCAGCTDVNACNYDATATISLPANCCYENCVTLIMNDSFGDGWNGATASIIDGITGNIVGTAGLPTGSNGSASFCLATGCYTIIVGGGTFDQEVSWTLTGLPGVLTGNANDPDGVGFSVGGANCVPACTEPMACNYDPTAGISDCTLCDYSSCSGCTYDNATNYDPAAVIDDGSCEFLPGNSTCPSDLDLNGIIGVSDLLIFIGDYGQVCPTN
jgi:hypothetical protein